MYEKSKAIVVERPSQAEVKDIKLCPIDDDTIVVETKYSAISTGTELKVWSGLSGHLGGELWYPLIPGYEQVGEIVWVGKNIQDYKVGDRVMANEVRYYPNHCSAWGGQCKLSIKNKKTSPSPFDSPAKIPDNVSYHQAVLAYLAAVAEKGIHKVKINAGETVLVIGLGMIGISAVQLAKLEGARVIAMDINRKRLELAESFADELIDARRDNPVRVLKQITEDKLADVIIECSGNPKVISELYQYLRGGGWTDDDDGGRIHLQGDYPYPIIINWYQPWFTKNMRISMTCAIRPNGKEKILKLLAEGKFRTDTILNSDMIHEISADDAQEAYKTLKNSEGDIFKILLKW